MFVLICADNAVDVYDMHPTNGEPVYVGTLDKSDVVYGAQFGYDPDEYPSDQEDEISPDVPVQLRDAWNRFVQYVFDTHIVMKCGINGIQFFDQQTGEEKSFVQLIQEARDFFLPVADVICYEKGGCNERG